MRNALDVSSHTRTKPAQLRKPMRDHRLRLFEKLRNLKKNVLADTRQVAWMLRVPIIGELPLRLHASGQVEADRFGT